MSPGFNCKFVFSSPVRMAGPCVSRRIATGRDNPAAIFRMRGTISRTHG